MQLDRRRADGDRRTVRRVPVVFAVKEDGGARVRLGQAEDITATGIALRWPKDVDLPREGTVALTFELPGTHYAIAARGLVVSERRSGRYRRTGVRFTALTAEAVAVIERYCSSRAAR